MEDPARLGWEGTRQHSGQRRGAGPVAAEQHLEAEKRELATLLALANVNVKQETVPKKSPGG